MSLEEVYQKERQKWDAVAFDKANKIGIHPLAAEEDFVRYSRQASTHIGVVEYLGDLIGKQVLEYGCGTGMMSVLLAKSGATVTAFDLSPVSVAVAKQRAEVNGVADRITFDVSPGENLPFESESFDLIFGKAILHHLNVHLGKADLHRLLKKGGRAVFVEPMGMNPILNFARDHVPYRHKNPRGMDSPLVYEEILEWGEAFSEFSYKEIQLLSMIDRGLGFKKHVRAFSKLDSVLLQRFPALRRYCRYVVMYMTK